MLPVYAARGEEYQSASTCLAGSDHLLVQCDKSNARLRIKSVGYGHTPDCENPLADNECTQTRLVGSSLFYCVVFDLCSCLPVEREQL